MRGINAHTHLELTSLAFLYSDSPLRLWMKQVYRHMIQLENDQVLAPLT